MKLECIMTNYELNFKTIFKIMSQMGKTQDLKFNEWTITDFDNFLNGNPHIDE